MALDQRKFEHKHEVMLRDVRPMGQRISETLEDSSTSAAFFAALAFFIGSGNPWAVQLADLLAVVMGLYFWWLTRRDRSLAFKMPLGTRYLDKNNGRGGKKGKAEGIMYMGNTQKTGEEVWFTNSDIRTHILYLGTTGAGKTEGLKSLVTNALAWSSGFVYVDGKADTDLWSSLSSLVRRFGRDDDLLVLNYMTGNSDAQAPSNSMNPFSGGSASYLTNMLVSLMPESGGDNAMWKERAVSLVGSMMPALTWKRDNQEIPLSVRNIRDYLSLNNIIKLSRDDIIPKEIRAGLIGYLDTLPGFIGDAYDDEGNVKPPGPDTPQYNTETASQQHGYLAMQFTRSLQSLGDDYGYIFDTQAADVDMVDVVLNRRILVVLVPALEKSGDEVANLGKIVASSIKGMMGSTLGATVEGSSASVIENKPTHSSTPFLTVFDEVGYYVAEGMAVMAAQARSLGFSLVFAGQDLPALKKRVREEANSITANCNVKLFGKLEDPTETKDFFEKTVGSALVTEVSGFQMAPGSSTNYYGSQQAGVQLRPRANYDELRGFKEGQAVVTFGEQVFDCAVFYSNPGFAKAMRVTRFMALPPPDENILKYSNLITKLRDLMVNKTWAAERADVAVETSPEIAALGEGFTKHNKPKVNPVDAGIAALVEVHAISNEIPQANETGKTGGTKSSGGGVKPAAPPPQQS
ncbi:MAG: type IV secretory system conjugative DNA transfer family protein, partial [Alphaproteobacteria bacterium]